MGWVFAALIVVVIGFVFLASLGRLGQMAPQIDDRPVPRLPEEGPLSADDLIDVQFAVVTRGYAMEQVDAVLDRVADQLRNEQPTSPTTAHGPIGDELGPVPNGWPAIG